MTKVEFGVLSFLAVSFLTGLFVYNTKYKRIKPLNEFYDYSQDDSVYKNTVLSVEKKQSEISENFIASEDKLYDFSNWNFRTTKLKKNKLKIVNINSAGIKELTKIPGIGVKTAQKIIEFRNLNGKFKTIDDLIKVKGIGKIKLNKIKKYINLD